MKKKIRQKYKLTETLNRIQRLPLDRSLKLGILTTWLSTFFLRRRNSRNGSRKVLGFDVGYLDFGKLSYLFNEIFLRNEYYFVPARKDPLIFDCGSNIGMSVLYFKALYPEARIVAFEPGEQTFACLAENIKRNHLQTSVQAHHAALVAKAGPVDFFFDAENPASLVMSTRQDRMPKQVQRVDGVQLSDYITEEVDFLKMDIEGAELDVLEELRGAGKLGCVKEMIIEYHHHIQPETDDLSVLLGLLEEAGFGYQLESGKELKRPLQRGRFQDFLICAYRKTR